MPIGIGIKIPPAIPLRARGARDPYASKVLGTQSNDLFAYWPLLESDGTTANNAEGTSSRNGIYNSDVSTWPPVDGFESGTTAPGFDGSNDYVNIYSSFLNLEMVRSAGTISVWVEFAGTWLDSTNRFVISIYADSQNYVRIHKNTAGMIRFRHGAGNVLKTIDHSNQVNVAMHLAMTWDEAADEFKAYVNGSQVGSTQSSLGTMTAGPLDNSRCLIGALDTGGSERWIGPIGHVAIWGIALSGDDVGYLSNL